MIKLGERLPAPVDGGFAMEGYWVWCGSVIKGEDGRYHMFASRWRKSLPMHPGWLLESEVVRAVSETPEGPYQFCEVVLPTRGAAYWDGRATHNPHIKKIGDTYVLFYTGITHPFCDVKDGEEVTLDDPRVIVARSNKRVGIATSKSILGPWKRMDEPILHTRPGYFDSYLTSNPAPCVNEDGSILLLYKARAYKEDTTAGQMYGDMSFGVACAPDYHGPYQYLCEKTIFPIDLCQLEDPYIWKTEDGYHMIAKDMDGRVCGEIHGGMQAYSKDGINWEMQKGVLAYSRKVLWDDGVERIMGSLERPFILFENGKATHMFFATADGPGGFMKATKTWNMVIPLKTTK